MENYGRAAAGGRASPHASNAIAVWARGVKGRNRLCAFDPEDTVRQNQQLACVCSPSHPGEKKIVEVKSSGMRAVLQALHTHSTRVAAHQICKRESK